MAFAHRISPFSIFLADPRLLPRPQSRRSGNTSCVLATELGNGWRNPLPLLLFGRLDLRTKLPVGVPTLLSQIVLTLSNESTLVVGQTQAQGWRAGNGATLRNNIYLGEKYDARYA